MSGCAGAWVAERRSTIYLKRAGIRERRVAVLAHGQLLKEKTCRLRIEKREELVGGKPLLGNVEHAACSGLPPVGANDVERALARENRWIVRTEEQPWELVDDRQRQLQGFLRVGHKQRVQSIGTNGVRHVKELWRLGCHLEHDKSDEIQLIAGVCSRIHVQV